MPEIGYNFSSSQIRDLAGIVSVDLEVLNKLLVRLRNDPMTIQKNKLSVVIEGIVGKENGPKLVRVIFGLAASFRRLSASAEDAISGVTLAVENGLSTQIDPVKWKERVPALLDILNSKSILAAAKAIDLSSDFSQIFISGRFMSDIRPIFDEERSDIIGSAIIQTLMITYHTDRGKQATISVAVDLDDIKLLQKECNKAIKKSTTIKSKLQDTWGLETIMPGNENHE